MDQDAMSATPITDAMVDAALDAWFDYMPSWREIGPSDAYTIAENERYIAGRRAAMRRALTAAMARSGEATP
jgi:hypothetical protein